MSDLRRHAYHILRQTFVVDGNPSQTRGRIDAGAMIYIPAMVAAVLALLIYFNLV